MRTNEITLYKEMQSHTGPQGDLGVTQCSAHKRNS